MVVGETLWLPGEVDVVPVKVPLVLELFVHEVAPEKVHDSVEEPPDVIDVGFAVKSTLGRFTPCPVTGLVAPPPPVKDTTSLNVPAVEGLNLIVTLWFGLELVNPL